MRKLNLTGTRSSILLRTLGQEKSVDTFMLRGLQISNLDGQTFMDLPELYTQGSMPVSKNNILTQEDLNDWPYLEGIKIPSINKEVELLIGINASNLMEPWEIINSQGGGPYAVKTLLGWVVNGPLRGGNSDRGKIGCPVVTANRTSVARLEDLLIAQYNQEFNEKLSEDDVTMSRNDKQFMEIMETSIKFEAGHYCIDLPFKSFDVILPNNRSIVEQRVLSLQRKFKRNREYQQEYATFLSDVIDKGYAEVVPPHQLKREDGKVWYIPHHGIYHPKKKTLRVVFDCGAVYKGTSLNCQLLQGPYLTNSLLGVLTRFRQEPVALIADIQAMFHQVKVSQKHVDFLRFLWFPGGDVTQDAMEYRMKVHLFGAVSSPSCANYALRRIAQDYQAQFDSCVLNTILQNFYMDDCLTSLPTEDEAFHMAQNLIIACAKGGFQLSKWMSNSRFVMSRIPEEYRSKSNKNLIWIKTICQWKE